MKKIGKYEITGILGKGAMGVVYKARDPDIDRDVAIKTIRFDVISEEEEREDLVRRFMREAQSAGKLVHPNIITVFDVGRVKDLTYIVMQYIEGQSLQKKIASSEELTIKDVISLMTSLCHALDYAHENGIIHRDIKPANVLIGKNGTPYVVDFGVARMETSTLTQTGATVGTPSYMSPEQVMGQKVDKRSDVFSLGVILYELITGKRPFEGDNITTVIYKIVNEEPPSPVALRKNLPQDFVRILNKALAKNPGGRYSSCRELARDLAVLSPLAEKTVTLLMKEEELTGLGKRRRWKPALVVAISLAAVIFIGGGSILIFTVKKEKAPSPSAKFQEVKTDISRSLLPPPRVLSDALKNKVDIIKDIFEKEDYSEVIRMAEEILAEDAENTKVKELLTLAKEKIEEKTLIAQQLAAGIQSYNQGDFEKCRSIMEEILRVDRENKEASQYLYLADTAISKKEILQLLERQRRAEEQEDLLVLLSDIGSEVFSNQRKEDAVLLFNYYDEIASLISDVSVKFQDRRHANVEFSHILTAVYTKTGQKKVVFEGVKTWKFEKQGNAWKVVGLK